MEKIRVVLADDHKVLRAGLSMLLNFEPDLEVVGEAGSGQEAVELAERLRPDIVVMDLTMPGLGGLEATPLVRRRVPATRVLILTMHDNPEYLNRALASGATGYVPKRAADTELIGAIRSVARGERFLGTKVARARPDDGTIGGGQRPAPYEHLTKREQQVLRKIAEGYTNHEIAEQLVISVKTVETHRAHILEKLDLHTRAELVSYARRSGLMEPALTA